MTRFSTTRALAAAFICCSLAAAATPALAAGRHIGIKKTTGHLPFDKPMRPMRLVKPAGPDYRFDLRPSAPQLHYEFENAYSRFMKPPAGLRLDRLDIARYGF